MAKGKRFDCGLLTVVVLACGGWLAAGLARGADKVEQAPGAATVEQVEPVYRASFHNLTLATGAMTAEHEELLLRYQACDLAHEIAFLQAVGQLELSKDQAEKLLASARKVREMAEQRAEYLRDSWKAYGAQCKVVRDNNISVVTGCDRELLESKIGKLEGMCGPPGYVIGRLDVAIRKKFYSDVAALGTAAEDEVLTAAQKAKLKDIGTDLTWLELPVHVRRALWDDVNVSLGTMGRLMLAPNAVAWLEQTAGQDAAGSVKRAADFQALGVEDLQLYRDMGNNDLRLVDGANIYAGMNFTEKQLVSLIELLQGEVKRIHDAHAEMNKKSLRPLVAVLTRMRDEAAAGKGMDAGKMQRVIVLQQGICRGAYHRDTNRGGRTYAIFCPLHKEYTDAMMAVFQRLQDGSVIDTAQCKLLYETHQCDWLPPKSYRDPVRVGQAAQGITYPEHAVLAQLRAAAEADYAAQRDAFAREIVAGIFGTHSVNPATREAELKRVTADLDHLRKLPDAAYELNKYALLAELLNRPCPEKTDGTGAEHACNGDIKELTWDTPFMASPYDWGKWDFMKAMEKAGKPLPAYSDKPIYIGWSEWPVYLQETPAKFLMDPDHVPGLKTLLVIARLPEKGGATDLDKLKKTVETGRDVGSR